MGWLDRVRGLLGGTGGGLEAAPDLVWATDAARLAGIAQRASELSQDGAVLVLAYFQQSLDTLAAFEAAAGWQRLERAVDVLGFTGNRSPGTVGIAAAGLLPSAEEGALEAPGPIHVLVAERHPLRSSDDAVLEAIATLGAEASAEFHLSLEDPLFVQLQTSLAPLLQGLGLGPDEPIQHVMVTRAVARAQEQLSRGASDAFPAESAEEWLQSNVRPPHR